MASAFVAAAAALALPAGSLGNAGGIIAFLAMVAASWFCGPLPAAIGPVTLMWTARIRQYGWNGVVSGYRSQDISSVIVITVVMITVGWAGKLRRHWARIARERQEQLIEQHRRKDEFLATLAHELRNPLAPLRSGLELLQLSAGDRLDPSAEAEVHGMMQRQLDQMVRLVDELLDISRINTGKIELRCEQVPLSEIVADALTAARPNMDANAHRLTVESGPPVFVNADRLRVQQAIVNVLNNAAKFTPRGGHITVTVEREPQNVAIHIADNGIGIAAESLPRVFDMFVQIDPALTRQHGGLGIGLSLSRALITRHGGSLEAASEGRGKGSRFTVRLPTVTGNAIGQEPLKPLPTTGCNRRVLVVDDNRDAAASLARLLGTKGIDCAVAHEGTGALELARSFRPDTFLLDIGMPGMSGYDLAQRLRSTDEFRDALMVAVTGWGTAEDRAKSAAAGFNHHLVKPVSAPDVLAILSSPA